MIGVSGFALTVGLNASQLAITVAAPDKFLNKTTGLLGVFNKDLSDDLTPANGAPALDKSATERKIFTDFGETCELYNHDPLKRNYSVPILVDPEKQLIDLQIVNKQQFVH